MEQTGSLPRRPRGCRGHGSHGAISPRSGGLTFRHGATLVHGCSLEDIKELLEVVARDPKAERRTGSLDENASKVANFVEETHSYIAGHSPAVLPDLRHAAQWLRQKVLCQYPAGPTRTKHLSVLKTLDGLHDVWCEIRHHSPGHLQKASEDLIKAFKSLYGAF